LKIFPSCLRLRLRAAPKQVYRCFLEGLSKGAPRGQRFI
jgi:hypothetical protein